MSKKTLLIGASGLIGSQIYGRLGGDALLTPSHKELDITDEESVKSYFADNPEISRVVNLAAYTNLTEAQKQRGDMSSPCWRINVVGVQNLVKTLGDSDVLLVQASTDYVFPGDKEDPGPYAEDHIVAMDAGRLSFYGYTKALAEKILLEALPGRVAIVRLISPVGQLHGTKPDYLRRPLIYFEKMNELYPIFDDQLINISDIFELGQAIRQILERRLVGIFHVGSSDITTPYRIVTYLFDTVYGHHEMVRPAKIVKYLETLEDKTRYHVYGGLTVAETERRLGIRFSDSEAIIMRLFGRSQP